MKAIAFALLLLVPFPAHCQARPAICEVRPLWAIKGGLRSANLGTIGTFQTNGREGVTLRSFKLPKTNLVISVGINHEFDHTPGAKPTPSRIALAITVSEQEEKDIFEALDSSEGSTRYTRNWNLRVTKNIFLDDRIYLLTLSCWEGTQPPSGATKR